MDEIKKIAEAISHFKYGINCDIYSEPVTTYAQLAVEALYDLLISKIQSLGGI